MDEVGEINDFIQAQAGQTAEIILGIGNDPTLGDKVGVTIIATGFKTSQQMVSELRVPEKIVYKLEDDKKAIVNPTMTEVSSPVQDEKKVIEPESLNSLEPVLIVRFALIKSLLPDNGSFDIHRLQKFLMVILRRIQLDIQIRAYGNFPVHIDTRSCGANIIRYRFNGAHAAFRQPIKHEYVVSDPRRAPVFPF
jgi:hypothetical protein